MDTKRIRRGAFTVLLVAALALALTGLAMLSAISSGDTEFGESYQAILIINVIGVLVLVTLIGGNLVRLYRDYRKRVTGARLKARLVAAFAALVIVPMAVVYFYSVQFLNQGIDSWFDLQVERGLGDALELSRVALDVRVRDNLDETRRLAEGLYGVSDADMYSYLSRLRTRSGAIDVTVSIGGSRIVATSSANPQFQGPLLPSEEVMLRIRRDDYYASLEPRPGDIYRVRTAVPLPGRYGNDARVLQAIYPLGNKIASLTDSVEATAGRYAELSFCVTRLKHPDTYAQFGGADFIVTCCVWRLLFARRLTAPVQNLVAGTRAVARGEFDKPLPPADDDELGFLVDSFNDMMSQLGTARAEARRSEAQVENERASLEAILGRLSSGVIAIENNLTLRIANASASDILNFDFSDRAGQSIISLSSDHPVLGQFVSLCAENINAGRTDWREQMTLTVDGERCVLVCACAGLPDSYRSPGGYVIVFEDVTELLRVQRDAAWGEVARRLAHEIKNPLTPIKLSAERIRHKYLDLIPAPEAEALDRATQTIIRQVEAMRDMVDAFSEYARAPELNLVEIDINRLIRNVAELYPAYQGSFSLELQLNETLPKIRVDALRMRQVLHNLIRNAIEALGERADGKVVISSALITVKDHQRVEIIVRDNGPGFLLEHMEEVFEPYVTTKQKGTGLGLAIVRKLIEEHGGNVMIDSKPDEGAQIKIYLPLSGILSQDGGVRNNEAAA